MVLNGLCEMESTKLPEADALWSAREEWKWKQLKWKVSEPKVTWSTEKDRPAIYNRVLSSPRDLEDKHHPSSRHCQHCIALIYARMYDL